MENSSCTFSSIEAEFSKSQPSQVVGFIVYQCISRAVEEGARGNGSKLVLDTFKSKGLNEHLYLMKVLSLEMFSSIYCF